MGRNLTPFVGRILIIFGRIYLVMSAAFFLSHILPAGPIFSEELLDAETANAIKARLGLDLGIFQQYWLWLKSALEFDFGVSFSTPDVSVIEVVATPIQESLKLAGLSSLFALALLFAWLMIYFYFPKIRLLLNPLITAIQSLPIYLIAAGLVYFFAIKNDFFPVALWESPMHMILPSLCLAIRPSVNLYRFMMAEMQVTAKQDFVRMAMAKGLGQRQIFFRYILRPSMSASVSYFAVVLTSLITGSLIVELLFAIPGAGGIFIESLGNRDFPVLIFLCGYFSFVMQLSQWGADLLRSRLDPRLRNDMVNG